MYMYLMKSTQKRISQIKMFRLNLLPCSWVLLLVLRKQRRARPDLQIHSCSFLIYYVLVQAVKENFNIVKVVITIHRKTSFTTNACRNNFDQVWIQDFFQGRGWIYFVHPQWKKILLNIIFIFNKMLKS